MADAMNNTIQIINEFVVLVCIWLMFHSTLYVPGAQTRYDLAWYLLYIIALDIALNVIFLVVIVTKKIYAAIKGCFFKNKA